jgi:hypothetical protein
MIVIGEAAAVKDRGTIDPAALQAISCMNSLRLMGFTPWPRMLYGNVGAMDRLDFMVIGPAVNEVARIETLCEPLGHSVLVSAELASAAGNKIQLEPLGAHLLRGVREPKEIFALRLQTDV